MSRVTETPATAGSRRATLRQQLTMAWVKKFRPDVYEKIEQVAAAKVPYVERSGPSNNTELPPELASFK